MKMKKARSQRRIPIAVFGIFAALFILSSTFPIAEAKNVRRRLPIQDAQKLELSALDSSPVPEAFIQPTKHHEKKDQEVPHLNRAIQSLVS